jgi:hypothetical protein
MNKEDVKASVKEYILKEFLAGENPENLTESTVESRSSRTSSSRTI